MGLFSKKSQSYAETSALRLIGETVRKRLANDSGVYRIPVDGLEIFGVADFFSAAECERLIAIVDKVARPSPTYKGTDATGRTS